MIHQKEYHGVKLSDIARYGVWLGVALTADANRREYNMQTTWLPHLLTNSLSLLLPDATRLVLPRESLATKGTALSTLEPIRQTLVRMVNDNPRYVVYVMPLAIGYMLSHPRFNIYKGELADIRLFGLGLDAIPHGATAFALTELVGDTVQTGASLVTPDNPLSPFLRWANANPAFVSFAVLALATFIWEDGEYNVHVYEMGQRGNDPTKINMQWSVRDTANDVFANLIGWLLASLLRRR